MVSTRSITTSKDAIIDEDMFHDFISEIEEDPEITLSMLFTQMKNLEMDLAFKIEIAKSDIVSKHEQENNLLKEELKSLKEDLEIKSKKNQKPPGRHRGY